MNEFLDYLKQNALPELSTGTLRVLGIDLGTTNSTAVEIVWSPRQSGPPEPRCVAVDQITDEGRYTHVLLPSMVAIVKDRVYVGDGAKRLRSRSSELGLERGRDLFWECKNDIGLARTYHRAPSGFRSAVEIGSQVIRLLTETVRAEDARALDRIVVTVPASFQTSQRRDTIAASGLAGLELVGGDLVDEPIAAFLDYGFTYGFQNLGKPGDRRNLLVFDFGGGTCDVAVFRVQLPKPGERITITPLAVSRYCRLGGGDIDAAIVHEVLIPQILEQNKLGPHDLEFDDKKKAIEPAFLGVAEGLKVSLCKEIARLIKFGRYQDTDKASIIVRNPGVHFCLLEDRRRLILQAPSLTAEQFLFLAKPFLDPDILAPRENEYRLTCSIFGPLSDALERSRLKPEDIDLCLLVGGSSLISAVQLEVTNYFPQAKLLTYQDAEMAQTAVARGGAYHALLLAATGKGVLQPVTGDSVCIQTETGPVELIPAHAPLPYPAPGNRMVENRRLKVPASSAEEAVDLRIELLDSEEFVLARMACRIPPPVRKGDPLVLRYRMDENQLLEMTLALAADEQNTAFATTIENPLTYVKNPQETRAKIDRLEEELRTKQVPRDEWEESFARLASFHEELNQLERAFDLLKKAMRVRGSPCPHLLNRMALVCDRRRDYQKAERLFREATEIGDDGSAMFNLTLSFQRRGLLPQAYDCILKALEADREAPYLVLQAQLANQLMDPTARDDALQESVGLFDDIRTLTDWELGWFRKGAEMRQDQDDVQAVSDELVRRRPKGFVEVPGKLPIINTGDSSL